jgi:hypothetical protein
MWSSITNINTVVPDPAASGTTFAERCAPKVFVEMVMDDVNTQLFLKSNPDITSIIRQAALDDCNILFSKASDVPANRSYLRVVVSPERSDVAGQAGYELGINAHNFDTGRDATDQNDFIGVMHHEIAHYYQVNTSGAPGWIIEGMADFVRFKSGYNSLNPRSKGGSYKDGYTNTAYFLWYLDDKYPNFVRQIELDLHGPSNSWDPNYFPNKTGKTVDDLWDEYQASF